MELSNNNGKGTIVFVLLLVKALYVSLIVLFQDPEWKYFDYDKYVELNNLIYEIPVLIIEISVFLGFYRGGNPITLLSAVLFCIYIIPMNSTLSLSSYGGLYFFFSNFFCIVLLLSLGVVSRQLPANVNENAAEELWHNKSFLTIMRVITIIICIGCFIYVYAIQGGINLSIIFDNDMYEQRADFADFYLSHTNGFLAYFIIIWRGITNTLLLICLYAALKQGRWIEITLVLFSYFLLFSLSMEKSIFFQPIIAVFIYWVEKKKMVFRVSELFVKGYFLLLTIVLAEVSILRESSILFRPIVSRMSYMPSYLNHTYYSFFENRPKIWLTSDFFPLDRLVRLLIPASCPDGMVKTISEYCFDGAIPSPNTGLFAESYAQMGFWGIFIFPISIAIISRIYTIFANNYGIAGAMILMPAFGISLINTAVFSTMGMVRIIIFILITWLIVSPIVSKSRSSYRLGNKEF